MGLNLIRGLFLAGIWTILAIFLVVIWCAWTLPKPDAALSPSRSPSITILGEDGTVLAAYGDLYAERLDFDDVPPFLVQAILATEDRRFFDHSGIDLVGIIRAAWVNFRARGIRQGGSTLTQQIAKNLFLTRERSFKRKIQEALLAFWLEAKFDKKQLFTIYLNRMYLGSGTYGVSAASRRYFGIPASAINFRQASVLAGLLKAPSRYSPIRDKAAAIRRGDQVIKNMVTQGFISPSYAALVKRQTLALVPQKGSQFRYFVDWVVDRTSGFIGRPDSDLIVRTTLDPQLQSIAGRAVRKNLDRTVLIRGGTQAALVTLDKGGAIRALVGGVNYKTSQFNRVTQALRQPGSAFKVFVYLAALEEGFEPEDVLQDGPIKIDGWEPRNYDGKFRGDVTLIDAVSGSLNSVAVKLSETIGREKVIAMAQRLGITTPLKSHPSLALGVNEVTLLELTSAYAVLANQGLNAWPYGITEIRDTQGSILYRRVGSVGRLLETQVVDRMVTMLRKTVVSGTGRAAQISRRAAGKTGTSQDFRDAWFLGFTDGLTTGVWVGNDKGRPMKRLTGGSIPAKIWRDLMKEGVSR